MLFRKRSKREEIERHYEKYFGKIHMVFHELVSPDFHLDVYWIKTKMYGQKVNVLTTIGMSDLTMQTPVEFDSFKYAELCILLPEDWKLTIEDFKDENNYWPIRLLKDVARFPHENNTWIGLEHTIGNETGEPYAQGVKFNGTLVFIPMALNQKFFQHKFKGDIINFYSLIPIYPEELNLKLENGIDSLFEKFELSEIRDIVDINRVNVGLN